ncbi:hypothetical protein Tco_0368338 [Tanacetum coccineum]
MEAMFGAIYDRSFRSSMEELAVLVSQTLSSTKERAASSELEITIPNWVRVGEEVSNNRIIIGVEYSTAGDYISKTKNFVRVFSQAISMYVKLVGLDLSCNAQLDYGSLLYHASKDMEEKLGFVVGMDTGWLGRVQYCVNKKGAIGPLSLGVSLNEVEAVERQLELEQEAWFFLSKSNVGLCPLVSATSDETAWVVRVSTYLGKQLPWLVFANFGLALDDFLNIRREHFVQKFPPAAGSSMNLIINVQAL